MFQFNSTRELVEDIKQGKMIILLDDEDRENEGDFVCAANLMTAEKVNFMASIGKGLICTPITETVAKRLNLPLMIQENTSDHSTAFTISVDAKDSTTTGISVSDRCNTIKLLANSESTASQFKKPGHIFPLIAKSGGVLERAGHTEASVDLVKLAGQGDVAVICEILAEDGSILRGKDLFELAQKHKLKIGTIEDLKKYLASYHFASDIRFPNKYGEFRMKVIQYAGEEHTLIYKGDWNDLSQSNDLLIRIHSECFTGDIFGSQRCDCGEQLENAMKLIEEEGKGILFYLKQEGRGIGLLNKIKTYELQELGFDTVEANLHLGLPVDSRTYSLVGKILNDLKISSVRLLTNNPDKIDSLENVGIKVESINVNATVNAYNHFYLKTKKEKLNHNIIL
jgi:3,4-dihydroxy 2-butanone 4-phosphate synthase/GTP cyclohydrolase II